MYAMILLTDGCDNDRNTINTRARNAISQSDIVDLKIHCFGYGQDHDARSLNSITDLTGGNYYYIEEYSKIAEAFSNCMGELTSVVADKIHVRLEDVPNDPHVNITKVFNDDGMNFKVPPLLSGSQKDSVFLITVPPGDLSTDQLELTVAKATITYTLVKTEEVKQEECRLTITFKSQASQVDSVEIAENILIQYFRVKVAEVLKSVITMANQNQMTQAQAIITQLINELTTSPVSGQALIQELIRDLNDARQRTVNSNTWQQGGYAQLAMNQKSHQMQ